MNLGFLTACLPQRSHTDIAAWAAANAFEALEVAAWPAPVTATHLDVNGFSQRQADEMTALFDQHGVSVSSLAFYDDTLYEGGFDGVFSVEHEDPVWVGTEDRIETGLRVAHRTLRPLPVA